MQNSLAEPSFAAPPRQPGWWAPVWVIAYVALLPLPGIAESVLVLGALFTVLRLLLLRLKKGAGIRSLLGVPALALTSVLFCAYWLPQLGSALGAEDAGKVWGKVGGGLRYLPFMWLVAIAVATPQRRRVTFGGLALVTGVWAFDALLQAFAGTSPLFWGLDQLKWLLSGHGLCSPQEAAMADRLAGIFGPCNLKFGQVLASLSPFLLFFVGLRWGRWSWVLAAAVVGVVLVYAGSRASLITYGLVLLVSGWRLLGGKWLLLLILAGVIGVAAVAAGSSQVRERFERTAMAFGDGAHGINEALSGRAQIWAAALCMVREHPINGVGARGFREAYPHCNPDASQAPVWGDGPALHAHQIVLEILAETGLLGLLLWIAGAAMALRAWIYSGPEARERARPAAVALGVTVFPFNTHLAFYSAFWGGLTVMLAALYAGALLAEPDKRGD